MPQLYPCVKPFGRFFLRSLFVFLAFLFSTHTFGKYAPAPVVTGPGFVATVVGGTITINGNYFTGATAVLIGGNGDTPAASFTVVSDIQIKAVIARGTKSGYVKIITPAGSSVTGLMTVSILPIAYIDSFTPTSGTAGTEVTIKGFNFTGARAVSFGGTAAASYTIVSDTVMRAVVGSGATGQVLIDNSSGQGYLGTFTYVSATPIPNIKSFTPASATTGTTVTIKGNYLNGATAVTFGGVAASSFTVVSDTVISAVVASGAGSGAVTVTTPGGTYSISGFTYVAPGVKPHISSFTPTSASPRTIVTIKGVSLSGATEVSFGGIAASSFSVTSDTEITAEVSYGATGWVKVVTPGGVDSLGTFTFIPAPPAITWVGYGDYNNIPQRSVTIPIGYAVNILGQYFTGATAVTFGGVPAQSFTVISDNQIKAIVGREARSGAILVTGPGGTSPESNAGIVVDPIPYIDSFTPTSGTAGTEVTIKGFNFTRTWAVSFGGTAAASYTIVSDSVIRAVVGRGSTGQLRIENIYGYRFQGTFTYVGATPIPNIISFTPVNGTTGTTVTIKGNYFTGATAVTIGGVAASAFSVVSDSIINAVVASGAGSGAVTVTTPGGIYSLSGFTYVAPDVKPHVNSFTPTSAAPRTTITIKGYNFTGSTQVNFGGTPASSFSVVSDTVIAAVMFSGSTGAVKVTTPAGVDSLGGFTYMQGPPEVPYRHVEAGVEDTIDIYGNFLTGATAVLIGSGETSAESFTVVSDSQIRAVVAKGTQHGYVKVTTPYGSTQPNLQNTMVVTIIPSPHIYSFTPTSGTIGTVVTIKGYNFANAKEVIFGGTNAASYTVEGDTIIRAVVGAGRTGKIQITNGGYYFGYKGTFTYIEPATQPVITSFDPTSGTTGTIITIKGKNFTGVNSIAINGTAALWFTVASDTVISAEVATGTSTGVGVVRVTTRDGLSASLFGFTYIKPTPSPIISSFSPTSGTTGTIITIKGSYFTGVTAVNIGGKAAATFTVVSDTIINAVVAAGASSGFVAVINSAGSPLMYGFIYIAPNLQPKISLFTPSSGTTGTEVTIRGVNFTGAKAVSFGGTAAASYTIVSDSVIRAVVGTGSTGQVLIDNGYGQGSLGTFTYVAPTPVPNIISFTPVNGTAGTTVTIKGNYFTGANAVTIGGVAASSFNVTSDTIINAVVAVGTASGSISVTTAGGTASLSGFTYVTPNLKPHISSFTPTSGTDGTVVTIKGSNFINVTAVSFGGTPAATFTVNDSVITAQVGSGATGVVKVTTNNGSDTLGLFTYTANMILAAPNPATGYIIIDHPVSANNAAIKLTNSMGNIVQDVKIIPGNSQARLDLTNVAPGIYIIWWTDGANSFSKTVLVK